MAGKKKNIEELYNAIFSIREALQDAVQLASEAAVISEAFGGEISRVITAQLNQYFIPVINKYIDDAETPGAMSPLVTFLDSVPLAMTRQESTPEQTTPAPISTELVTPPTAEPAEGSFAAQKQESAKSRASLKEDFYADDPGEWAPPVPGEVDLLADIDLEDTDKREVDILAGGMEDDKPFAKDTRYTRAGLHVEECSIGDTVRVSDAYGGGTGRIVDFAPSGKFATVEINGEKESYSVADLTAVDEDEDFDEYEESRKGFLLEGLASK